MRQRVVAVAVVFLSLVSFQPKSPAQSQVDHARKVVSKVEPLYPELARKMSIQGLVRLEVIVTGSGHMKHAEVLGGNPLLAKSAIDAIEKWKWEPSPQETHEVILLNFHPD